MSSEYIQPGIYVDRPRCYVPPSGERRAELYDKSAWFSANVVRLHTLKITGDILRILRGNYSTRQTTGPPGSTHFSRNQLKTCSPCYCQCPFLSKIDRSGCGKEHFKQNLKFRFDVHFLPYCFIYWCRINQKTVTLTLKTLNWLCMKCLSADERDTI